MPRKRRGRATQPRPNKPPTPPQPHHHRPLEFSHSRAKPSPHSDVPRLCSSESGKTTPRLRETSRRREARKSPRSAPPPPSLTTTGTLQHHGHAPEPRGRGGGAGRVHVQVCERAHGETKRGQTTAGQHTRGSDWHALLLLCVQKISCHLSAAAEAAVSQRPHTATSGVGFQNKGVKRGGDGRVDRRSRGVLLVRKRYLAPIRLTWLTTRS